MTQEAFKELYELLTSTTQVQYVDIDKGLVNRENERIERYPAMLWGYDASYNTDGIGRRKVAKAQEQLTAKLVFENMKRDDTYLNTIEGNGYLNEEGMNFLGIKEEVRRQLHGYTGEYVKIMMVTGERLDTSEDGLTIIEFSLEAEVKLC